MKARLRRSDLVIVAALAWLALWPILITAWAAFESPAGPGAAFVEFARRAGEWTALERSLVVAFASVGLAAAVGVPLAFLFARTEFRGRRVLGELVALPVALPPLVGVIAFLYLWGETGLGTHLVMAALGLRTAPWRLTGLGAILLVHTYSMYVYFYLFVRAALLRFDSELVEAAASLGAGRARTFFRVTLPALRPALSGAAVLTFLTALGSFSAPYIFGGSYRVMPTQILASKQNGNLDLAEVETIVLTLVALAALALARWLERERTASRRRGTARPPPRRAARAAAKPSASAAAVAAPAMASELTIGRSASVLPKRIR